VVNGRRVRQVKGRSPKQRSAKQDRTLAVLRARGDVNEADLGSLLTHYNDVFAGTNKLRIPDLYGLSPKRMGRVYDSWRGAQEQQTVSLT
jgi:hypothetical protein